MPSLRSFTRVFAAAAAALALAGAGRAFAETADPASVAWVEAVHRESALGDLDQARASYEDLAARFPDHPKAPASLFRAALCLEKAGDAPGARQAAELVVTRYPRALAARTGAEEILKRLSELSARSARESENRNLVRENEALKLRLSALTELLDRTRSAAVEGARGEEARKIEVEALRRKIDELSEEGRRLREKLKSVESESGGAEPLTPEEILTRLEQEAAVREQERRTLSEHFFKMGLKYEAEEKFQEALENFRQSLKLWDGHPFARERLSASSAMLGLPGSAEAELMAQLEIKKQVGLQEAKAELANTFRQAFEAYGKASFEEAGRLFRAALDILVTRLPAAPEVELQKDLAAQYLRLSAKGRRDPGQDPPAAVLRIAVVAAEKTSLAAAAAALHLEFLPSPETRPVCALALLPPGRVSAFRASLGRADVLIDEKLPVAPGEPAALSRSVPDGAGFERTLRVRVSVETLSGGANLRVAIETVHPPERFLDLPGAGRALTAGDPSRRVLEAGATLGPGSAVLIAGARNPFVPAGEVVVIIELQGP